MSERDKMIEGWNHFCKTINFKDSALDAEAIVFMNTFTTLLDNVIEEGVP